VIGAFVAFAVTGRALDLSALISMLMLRSIVGTNAIALRDLAVVTNAIVLREITQHSVLGSRTGAWGACANGAMQRNTGASTTIQNDPRGVMPPPQSPPRSTLSTSDGDNGLSAPQALSRLVQRVCVTPQRRHRHPARRCAKRSCPRWCRC
jgi:hypothetical protein